MNWTHTSTSSVIAAFAYVRVARHIKRGSNGNGNGNLHYRGKGFILIRFKSGAQFAYLLPSNTYGLMVATVRANRSIGRMYNRLIKGKEGFPVSDNDTVLASVPMSILGFECSR